TTWATRSTRRWRGRWRTPPTAGGTSCWSAAPTTTRTGNARWSPRSAPGRWTGSSSYRRRATRRSSARRWPWVPPSSARTAPTAVFASNDLSTMGAIDGLGDAGRRVALVGFDDFPLADKLSPPVTVVSQDPATIGATAAQLLFSRIDGNNGPARWVMLLTRFVARGSGEIRA